ncbi:MULTISPECIES: RidA family protein [Pseudomonas]|uniref:RidA family protein n=1 Tax=Pseudomonas TaxID=286 RepID=UPI00021731AF|nr:MULTISPECIES: RidA family protein [Pseudomonas]AEJ12877.1 endoribonuclease L-PSP family protein [Pseudomonas putida S16]ELF6208267.1 RidA family protein [Pseudomonas putida]WOB61145.1 RidA family protein [Pseudomonas sp. NBB]
MIERIKPGSRASQMVIIKGRIETSGIVAQAPQGNITEQTQCVLAQLERWFSEVGAGKKDISRIQIWLANMDDFAAMNAVYDAWVGDEPPVRACVGAPLAAPEYLIEIQAFGEMP